MSKIKQLYDYIIRRIQSPDSKDIESWQRNGKQLHPQGRNKRIMDYRHLYGAQLRQVGGGGTFMSYWKIVVEYIQKILQRVKFYAVRWDMNMDSYWLTPLRAGGV